MKRYKVGLIITIVLVLIFGLASSYAFFIYKGEGNDITLTSGDISLNFTSDVTDISIPSARPTSDGLGKIYPYYVNFDIDGTVIDEGIKYQIQLVPTANTTIDLSYIKGYLTDQDDNEIQDVFSYNDLSDIDDSTGKEGKVIYTNYFTSSETHHYRLRIWINDEYASEIPETFGFKVYLYAENGEPNNVMGVFPTAITDKKTSITEVYFINDSQSNIDTRYNAAALKADVTNTDHTVGTEELQHMSNYGLVLAWLEADTNNEGKYKLYVGSDGPTYLSTGERLFEDYRAVSIIDMKNAKTDFVTNMSSMFRLDRNLWSIDVSGWDTSNVNNMSYMFDAVASSDEIVDFEIKGIEDWNTEKLEDAKFMFNDLLYNYNNSNTINYTLDLHKWNVTNLKDAGNMFYLAMSNLKGTKVLNLSHWNLASLTSSSQMFLDFGYNGDVTLDISYWKFPSSINDYAFNNYGNYNKYTLNASHVDFSNVVSLTSLFNGINFSSQKSVVINVDYANFSSGADVSKMLSGIGHYSSSLLISCKGWNISNLSNTTELFSNNTSEDNRQNFDLDLSDWVVSNSIISKIHDMLDGLSLENLNLSNWNLGTTTLGNLAHGVFSSVSIETLDLSNWNFDDTNLAGIFSGINSIEKIILSNWNVSNITSLSGLFANGSNFKEIDLSGWDTSNVTNMANMFYSCTNLTTIYVSDKWDSSNLASGMPVFNGCTSLVGSNGTTYDSNHVDPSYAHIDGGTSNPGYLTLKTN